MSDIKERLKKILTHYNINSADFSNMIGVQKSSISHLLSGRNKPSFDFINKVSDTFDEIDIGWFVTGKGEMFKTPVAVNDYSQDAATVKVIEKTAFNQDTDKPKMKQNVPIAPEKEQNTNIGLQTSNEINSVLLIYDNDSFKILKQR